MSAFDADRLRALAEKAMVWNGYPPDPQTSGWHMLRQGSDSAAYWDADRAEWTQGGICCGGSCKPDFMTSKHFVAGVQYLGRIVVADAILDRLAALERVRAAAEEMLDLRQRARDHVVEFATDGRDRQRLALSQQLTERAMTAEAELRAAIAAAKDPANAG